MVCCQHAVLGLDVACVGLCISALRVFLLKCVCGIYLRGEEKMFKQSPHVEGFTLELQIPEAHTHTHARVVTLH